MKYNEDGVAEPIVHASTPVDPTAPAYVPLAASEPSHTGKVFGIIAVVAIVVAVFFGYTHHKVAVTDSVAPAASSALSTSK